MKTTAMVMLAMAATGVARVQIEQADPAPKHTMTAYIEDHGAKMLRNLASSEKMASRMFAAAGLKVEWRAGRPAMAPTPADMVLVIDIVDRTPAERNPGALAFALPFEGVHLTVFYDRVADTWPYRPDVVLAHVLVHEITHLLQGTALHSETGIMKARYDQDDHYQMLAHRLPFTPNDLVLIELGIANRLHARVSVANEAETVH